MKKTDFIMAGTLVAVIPLIILINEMESAIAEYKVNPSEENKQRILSGSMAIVMKSLLETNSNDPISNMEKIIEEVEEIEKALELLKPNKS